MQQGTTLPGDTLLVTAFISYVGCFTKQFRLDLMNKMWLTYLNTLEPPIPITEGLDSLCLLTDDTTIALWQNEGLPSDRMSIENATILSNSDRWPLMIGKVFPPHNSRSQINNSQLILLPYDRPPAAGR